jgi:penicillin amidase
MPRLVRALAALLVLLAVVVTAAWFGGRAWLARSVAQHAGEAVVPGLDAPVEITFDARGVPQVWAETDRDLRFAQGWLHASERLFQMELTRRMARGELAELFGAEAVPLDRTQRELGFAWQVERDLPSLPSDVRAALADYVAGVNAWVAQAPVLPPEFVVLRHTPRPWTVEDVLVTGFYQTWYSLSLMDRGADYRDLFRTLGGDASRLANAVQRWSPPTVPSPAPRLAIASNSWVIAPSRSRSGAALHASDPHLETSSAPGLWYALGLHSRAGDGLDAVGVSAPGVPGVAMGHNTHIAWAFTVAPVDLVDEYWHPIEDAEGAAPRIVTARGAEPLVVREERIVVQGSDAAVVRLLRAMHGPVVAIDGDSARVLRWAGFDRPAWEPAAAIDGVLRARDFATFQRTVTHAGAFAVNWTYSDRAGNIGYQLGAPIPVRDGYDTFTPQSGLDTTTAWRGWRPLAETPYALNPAQGWLGSTNNQVVDASWPYALPGYYDLARATRLEALLTTRDTVSAADMQPLQLDLVSGIALRWRTLAADAAAALGRDDVAARLRAWNGSMAAGDTTATLFAHFWEALPRALFEDEVAGAWRRARPLAIAALEDSAAAFADDARTPARESVADVAQAAMRAALAERWQRPFGQVQTLTVRHPLARVALLDRWLGLTRGPFPLGGDDATLNAAFTTFDSTTRTLAVTTGPSMRFVLDWADVDGFTLSRHLGQSGNPLSPHFDDFLAPHLGGEAWPMPVTRARVLARATSTLWLRPAR